MSTKSLSDYLTQSLWTAIDPLPVANGWQPIKTISGQWIVGNQSRNTIAIKDFIIALRLCKIVDTEMPSLPGAFCLLPTGVKLQHRFQAKVRSIYEKFGLEEYDYPMVIPVNELTAYLNEMGLTDKVVYTTGRKVDRDKEWILNPTGEPAIYPHWKKILRNGHPLPIRMYRLTTYFRALKGKHTESIFSCAESSHIFEFHCAYPNKDGTSKAIQELIEMMKELFLDLHLPFICSIRPLFTNNFKVSKNTIGFDVSLPTGKSIQLASIYDQDDLLSKVFDVRVNKSEFTSHLTGYISRRSLLVQLLIGLTSNQYFILPSDIQPVNVLLVIKDTLTVSLQETEKLISARGIRVALEATQSVKKIQVLRKRYRQMCATIDVIIIPPLSYDINYKIIITRYDTEEEKILYTENLLSLALEVESALNLCDKYYDQKVALYRQQSNLYGSTVKAVQEIIKQGKTAICPLRNDNESLLKLEAAVTAEVLGFSQALLPQGNCIITHQPVDTIAFVARRV